MSIETKFLIGLLLLMALGSFTCSLFSDSSAFSNMQDKLTAFADEWSTFQLKNIGQVSYTGGEWLLSMLAWGGEMIFWNFSFFEGFEWIQVILCLINFAIFIKIAFDIYRALKPFGG